jgi:hypothetical protein
VVADLHRCSGVAIRRELKLKWNPQKNAAIFLQLLKAVKRERWQVKEKGFLKKDFAPDIVYR